MFECLVSPRNSEINNETNLSESSFPKASQLVEGVFTVMVALPFKNHLCAKMLLGNPVLIGSHQSARLSYVHDWSQVLSNYL